MEERCGIDKQVEDPSYELLVNKIPVYNDRSLNIRQKVVLEHDDFENDSFFKLRADILYLHEEAKGLVSSSMPPRNIENSTSCFQNSKNQINHEKESMPKCQRVNSAREKEELELKNQSE